MQSKGIRTEGPGMRTEHNFSNLRPNRYAKKYAQGANIVLIDPNLTECFPDSESSNAALRAGFRVPQGEPEKKVKQGPGDISPPLPDQRGDSGFASALSNRP